MDDSEHLLVAGPCILLNSVKTQGFRRAAAALIQRRNETGTGLNFLQLFCVNGDRFHDVSLILGGSWFNKGIDCTAPTTNLPSGPCKAEPSSQSCHNTKTGRKKGKAI